MRSAATALALAMAVGGTSLICYLLMRRLQNRLANRGSSGQSPSPDGGNYAGATAVAEATNAAGSADNERILICRNRTS
jgi:hypothetical protein